MFANYLKVAIRNLGRHKGYTAINIAGLAVGMACCLLLSIYVIHELNYDRQYADSDRIYRVETYKKTPGEQMHFAGSSPLLLSVLTEECSEVEAAFHVQGMRPTIVRQGEMSFIEDGAIRVDDGIFDVLGLRLLHGEPGGLLTRPRTAVLTEEIATKYFGGDNPVGRTLQIDTIGYEITGVVADQPTNTHIKFRILCSSSTRINRPDELPPESWGGPLMPTYVKLADGAEVAAFAAKIRNLPSERPTEGQDENGEEITFAVQSIRDVHLSPPLKWDWEPPGNPVYVISMAATALLVLLIACVNYLNLNTARAAGRAVETGIRKATGAQRPQLFWQFMSESFLISIGALAVASVLVELGLPLMSATTGIPFGHQALMQPEIISLAAATVIVVSILAGTYPALYLSGLRPVAALKSGSLATGRQRVNLRKVLVVGQLIIVGILLVGVVTVYRQMEYMTGRPLGFDKEAKLVIEMSGNMIDFSNSETVKQKFKTHPSVLGATISTSVPGRWNYQWRTEVSGREDEGYKRVNWYGIDRDFLVEYGMELVAGESIWRDQSSAGGRSVLVNEAAVRAFRWGTNEDAVGQRVNNQPVVGIVRDFHFRGLQSEVEPLVMFASNEDYRYLSLRLDGRDLRGTMAAVKQTFEELFPEGVYNYFFLDDDFNRQYHAEANMARICAAFTMVGIVVAFLGLYALAVFLARRRTKEIGIRKVFGATSNSVTLLLLGEFVPLLIAAAAVAAPAAYLIMEKWLQQFAYRIDNGLATVALFTVAALLIMAASISYEALRAARANPIDSLKYE